MSQRLASAVPLLSTRCGTAQFVISRNSMSTAVIVLSDTWDHVTPCWLLQPQLVLLLQAASNFRLGMKAAHHVFELHYNSALLAHKRGDLQEALSQVTTCIMIPSIRSSCQYLWGLLKFPLPWVEAQPQPVVPNCCSDVVSSRRCIGCGSCLYWHPMLSFDTTVDSSTSFVSRTLVCNRVMWSNTLATLFDAGV